MATHWVSTATRDHACVQINGWAANLNSPLNGRWNSIWALDWNSLYLIGMGAPLCAALLSGNPEWGAVSWPHWGVLGRERVRNLSMDCCQSPSHSRELLACFVTSRLKTEEETGGNSDSRLVISEALGCSWRLSAALSYYLWRFRVHHPELTRASKDRQ